MSSVPKHIAIIGGGRWARVIAGVLCSFIPDKTRLSLCSPQNSAGWAQWLESQPDDFNCECTIAPDINTLLEDETLTQVYVARAAKDNFSTAISALHAGKAVFIEKPFALNCAQAKKVLAAGKGQTCVTGLVCLFAPNLQRFADAIPDIYFFDKIIIHWHDPVGENRYGEAKSYDPGLNSVRDVFPHIWSLLRLLSPDVGLAATGTKTIDGGRRVQLKLLLDQTSVEVEIARDANMRRRTINLSGANKKATIDFSKEPGHAAMDGIDIDVVTGFSSPLAKELKSFFYNRSDSAEYNLCKCDRAIESIELADLLLQSIRRDQIEQIAQGLSKGASQSERHGADYALREIVEEQFGNSSGKKHQSTDQQDPSKVSWQTVREWLVEDNPKNHFPACFQEEKKLLDLKKRLSNKNTFSGVNNN